MSQRNYQKNEYAIGQIIESAVFGFFIFGFFYILFGTMLREIPRVDYWLDRNWLLVILVGTAIVGFIHWREETESEREKEIKEELQKLKRERKNRKPWWLLGPGFWDTLCGLFMLSWILWVIFCAGKIVFGLLLDFLSLSF